MKATNKIAAEGLCKVHDLLNLPPGLGLTNEVIENHGLNLSTQNVLIVTWVPVKLEIALTR